MYPESLVHRECENLGDMMESGPEIVKGLVLGLESLDMDRLFVLYEVYVHSLQDLALLWMLRMLLAVAGPKERNRHRGHSLCSRVHQCCCVKSLLEEMDCRDLETMDAADDRGVSEKVVENQVVKKKTLSSRSR